MKTEIAQLPNWVIALLEMHADKQNAIDFIEASSLKLNYLSKDMEEGYPWKAILGLIIN